MVLDNEMLLLEACRLFRTGDHCEKTYAEVLGRLYTGVHIAYVIMVFIMIIVTVPKAVMMFKERGFNWHTVQTRLHVYFVFGLLSLILRCIDPFGYRDMMPFPILIFAYDIGGAFIICTGLEIVFDWLRILHYSKGRLNISHNVRRLCVALQIYTIATGPTCGLFMTILGPIWFWHLIKVGCLILSAFVVFLAFIIYGARIHRVISDAEQNMVNHMSPSVSSDNPLPESNAHKIPKLVIIIVTIFGLSVIGWIFVIYGELKYKVSWEKPLPPPSTGVDILVAGLFDLLHFLGFSAIPIFFATYARDRTINAVTYDSRRTAAFPTRRAGRSLFKNSTLHDRPRSAVETSDQSDYHHDGKSFSAGSNSLDNLSSLQAIISTTSPSSPDPSLNMGNAVILSTLTNSTNLSHLTDINNSLNSNHTHNSSEYSQSPASSPSPRRSPTPRSESESTQNLIDASDDPRIAQLINMTELGLSVAEARALLDGQLPTPSFTTCQTTGNLISSAVDPRATSQMMLRHKPPVITPRTANSSKHSQSNTDSQTSNIDSSSHTSDADDYLVLKDISGSPSAAKPINMTPQPSQALSKSTGSSKPFSIVSPKLGSLADYSVTNFHPRSLNPSSSHAHKNPVSGGRHSVSGPPPQHKHNTTFGAAPTLTYEYDDEDRDGAAIFEEVDRKLLQNDVHKYT